MPLRCLCRRAALLSVVLSVLCSSALPQTAWRRHVELSANGDGVRQVAADDERFVAVGRHGLVMTSTDGVDWVERDSGTWEGLVSVRHMLGHFIATGEVGSLFVSPDGMTWTQQLGGLASSELSADDERLLVLGQYERAPGTVFVSTNLTQWTSVVFDDSLNSLARFNGLFLLTAENTPVSYSTDGLTWQPAAWGDTVPTDGVNTLAIVGDVALVATGPFGNHTLYRSTDGMTWSVVTPGFTFFGFSALADRFIVSQATAGDSPALWESFDGLTWTLSDLTTVPDNTVRVGDVEVDINFTQRRVGDGPWEPLSPYQASKHIFPYSPINTIAHGDGLWLTAFGTRSADGASWERVTTGPWEQPSNDPGFFRSVSFAGGRFFVLTGDFGDTPTYLSSSTDAVSFTSDASFMGQFLPEVRHVDGVWLTASQNGRSILRSTNGTNWNEIDDALPPSAGTTADGHTAGRILAATNTQFLLLIQGDGLYHSADGEIWLRPTLPEDPTAWFTDIAWHEGRYVAAGMGGRVFTSEDGWNWSSSKPPLTSIERVGFAGNHIVAVGRDGTSNGLSFIATSPDNVQWSRSAQPVDGQRNDVRAISSGADRTFVAVGDSVFYSMHGEGPVAYGPDRDDEWSVLENEAPMLSVSATSDDLLSYQWSRRGVKLPEATSATLSTSVGPPSTSGTIPLVVKVSDGTWTSAVVFYGQVHHSEPPTRIGTGIVVDYSAGGGTAAPYARLIARFDGPALTFQWLRDGVPIGSDNISPAYQTFPLNPYNDGRRFQVIVRNAAGTATSEEVVVARPDLVAGDIQEQRFDDQVWSLWAPTFGATHYQWRLNGEPIPGATQHSFRPAGGSGVESDSPLPSGFIDVLAFNARETVRSATYRYQRPEDPALPAETPVYPFEPQQPPELINLSVRGRVGTGEAALIAGQVIHSPGITTLEQPATILTRAIGPGLAQFDVPASHSDPRLQLFDVAGTELAANDNWGEHSEDLAPLFAEVGAFSLAADSKDAALLHAFDPSEGSIVTTAIVSATDLSPARHALIETYLLPDGNGSGFANFSARGRVEPDQPVTLGFVIQGDATQRLLLRALGPALADYGITDPAPSPRLRLFNATGELVAESEVTYPPWGGPLERIVGATPIVPQSPNALIHITLPAGTYTAQAIDDTGGIVLLELYQVEEPDFVIQHAEMGWPIDIFPMPIFPDSSDGP